MDDIRSRIRDERGATATEYGLLVLFIAFAVVGGATIFGLGLNTAFGNLATWVNTMAAAN